MTSTLEEPSPPPELPQGNLLPLRFKTLLERNGIYTVEAAFRASPDQLLKLHGMGISRFRQLERILFPGKSYTPHRVTPPIPQTSGSDLTARLVRALFFANHSLTIDKVEQQSLA